MNSTEPNPSHENGDPAIAWDENDPLLAPAREISKSLHDHVTALGRREDELNRQLSAVNTERAGIGKWVSTFEQNVLKRVTEIRRRELELDRKVDACETLLDDLQQQEQTLGDARSELDEERKQLKQEAERELKADREALSEAREAVEIERKRLSEEREQQREEHQDALDTVQSQLEVERKRLKTEMADQLERERRKLIEELKSDRQTLEREREEFQTERQTQLEELEEAKRLFHEEHTEQREKLEIDLTNFEQRMRFQENHLDKLRKSLEGDQREFRHERQKSRIDQERRERSLLLRTQQAKHHRTLLEQREDSIQRERELLDAARQTQTTEFQRDRTKLQTERDDWQNEVKFQAAEIRRQQDLLSLHAENLETRRTRLDQLRSELEETHRSTLENRLSVEEAWAEFSQTAGAEIAGKRVDASRRALDGHYAQVRKSIQLERDDLEESRTELAERLREFATERKTWTEWLNKQEEKLELREIECRREADALTAREGSWRTVRDRWVQEKFGAEEIIRDLLRQLTSLNETVTVAPATDGAGGLSATATPGDAESDSIPHPAISTDPSPIAPPHWLARSDQHSAESRSTDHGA